MIAHVYRWLGFGLCALLLLPVLLIRAQPFDEDTLRAVLTPPEGCYAPCFMGIVPGATRAEEAIALLKAHEWVATVTQGSTVSWTWSGEQPARIPLHSRGYFSTFSAYDLPLVASIYITTDLPYGELLLVYGNPNRSYVAADHRTKATYVYYKAVYGDLRFQARLLPVKCPFRPLALYHEQVRIEMGIVNDAGTPGQLMSFGHEMHNLVTGLRHMRGC